MSYRAEPYTEPSKPVGKVAELFAGVGGFRVGLSRANLKTVFSNQWEPSTKVQHASDVYVARFGSEGHSNKDIASVEFIPQDFDVLVGGFPCQDYSVAKAANSATGLQGKKGVLWWEILRLSIQHKPKFIFLENVDRLLKSPTGQRGRDFAVMLTTLGNAGYWVEWRVVNAAEYGLPQRRVRVFIVATRQDIALTEYSTHEEFFLKGVLTSAFPILSGSAQLQTFELSPDPVSVSNDFNSEISKQTFGNAGVFMCGKVQSWKAHAAWDGAVYLLNDVLVDDNKVPDEFWIAENKMADWAYLKGSKSIERTHKDSGFKYLYSEGAITYPDSLEKPSRTILTGEGGSTPTRFKHVISRPRGLRRLVPVELERLCGFPDDWTNPRLPKPITDSRRAFFIGNALVVGLVDMVGKQIASRLEKINQGGTNP